MDINFNITGRSTGNWTIHQNNQRKCMGHSQPTAFEMSHTDSSYRWCTTLWSGLIFSTQYRIHKTISMQTILSGIKIDHNQHCTWHSLMVCTTWVIALWPTANTQGTHYFLNINTGRWVTRNNWTVLPIPSEVIHIIHRLAVACKKHKGIVFHGQAWQYYKG